jgi:hypothetical protein
MSNGSSFHSLGALTENALKPYVFSLYCCGFNINFDPDLRLRGGYGHEEPIIPEDM